MKSRKGLPPMEDLNWMPLKECNEIVLQWNPMEPNGSNETDFSKPLIWRKIGPLSSQLSFSFLGSYSSSMMENLFPPPPPPPLT